MENMKLAAIDLDGTLLNSQIEISKENLNAIEEALDEGVLIVPSTGRPLGLFPKELTENSRIRYVITSNGANVIDIKEKKSVYKNPIPAEAKDKILDILQGYDVFPELYIQAKSMVPSDRLEKIEDYIPEVYQEFLAESCSDFEPEKIKVLFQDSDIEKINLFFKDPSDRAKMEEELKQIQGIATLRSAEGGLEIMDALASKGNSLKHLCDILGIDRKHVIACGDSLNDIAMLEFAQEGIAVANANDQVKKIADWVGPSHDDDAVAVILRRYLGEKMTENLVYCYPKCSTCKKALKFLDEEHVPYKMIDIVEDTPDVKTIEDYIERSKLPVKRFFNTSGMKYRELGLKDKVDDMSLAECCELLASDGMLLKRPLLVTPEGILPGFRQAQWEVLLGL